MMQIETPPDAVIESTASIDVEHDGPANWAANFQYVSAAIEACGTESVEISPPNGDGPIRIDAYGGETPVTCVVMPMRG